MAKKTPEINSSSTADIAFLLLIYFLMTSSMDQKAGLQRRLPPMPDKDQKVEDQKVNRRNICVVKINSQDRVLAGTEPIDVTMLKEKIKEFLANPNNDPELPEKTPPVINGKEYMVSKGVISLKNDRVTRYQAYISVQNEIVKAINELRDEFSKREYGKTFLNLDPEFQEFVKKAIPQNISEAEPKDVAKK